MFPRVLAALIGTLAVGVGMVIVVALYLPGALHALTILAALVVFGAAYRDRAGYGRSRGLPPGSLSLGTSLEALVDRDFYRKQAARYGPIFKMAQFHRPTICLVGLARGQQLLHEHEEALGPSIQRFSHAIPGRFLRYMNVETHSLYGPLFRQALSPQTIDHGWPVAVATTRRELGVAASLAKGTGTGTVEPNDYLERIVTHTFQRTLFGITPGTPASERLTRVYAPLASMALSDQPTREARTALDELRRMLRAQSDEWRLRPGPGDPPVCALGELGRLDAHMPDVTCVDNLVFIYKISSANVAGLLRWLLAILGRH
ncbi:MAG: hypothetical protein ACRD2N_21250, partial [Vicinamibacterales bacterium]